MNSVYKISEEKALKNKKSLILVDEDIYIDLLDIQVYDKNKMLEIIKEHLVELFNDINDIVFHIEKIKIGKKISILLYCIKCRNKDLMSFISKGKIKLIPIQFYFHKKYRNKLTKENCIMVFENGGSLYRIFQNKKLDTPHNKRLCGYFDFQNIAIQMNK